MCLFYQTDIGFNYIYFSKFSAKLKDLIKYLKTLILAISLIFHSRTDPKFSKRNRNFSRKKKEKISSKRSFFHNKMKYYLCLVLVLNASAYTRNSQGKIPFLIYFFKYSF